MGYLGGPVISPLLISPSSRVGKIPANARFAGTTFVLSMVNARVRGITVPNIVVGLAYGYGGLVQLIAGVEEWACGNVSADHPSWQISDHNAAKSCPSTDHGVQAQLSNRDIIFTQLPLWIRSDSASHTATTQVDAS